MQTTVGQMMINEALPEDLRDYSRVLDRKGIRDLLRQVAEKYPEKYPEISHKLMNVGQSAATTGNFSFSLQDLRPPASKRIAVGNLRIKTQEIINDPRLDTKQRHDKLVTMLTGHVDNMIKSTLDESHKNGSRLAEVVRSGSKGSPGQFNTTVGAPLLYLDHKDHPVPIPVFNSVSEGLDPVEYWASTYGTRKGLMSTKHCLSGTTLVRMADWSTRKICDLRLGDLVLGANSTGATAPVAVRRVFDNGVRECRRYMFSHGKVQELVTLDCTPEHRILAKKTTNVQYSDVRQYELSHAGKDFRVSLPAGFVHDGGVPEEKALLLGLLLGDGCTKKYEHLKKQTFQLSCADQSLIDDVSAYLSTLNLTLHKAGRAGYAWNLVEVSRSKLERDKVGRVTGSGSPIKKWVSGLGLDKVSAHEKALPGDINSWNNQSIAQVLGGLFSTDGCVYESDGHGRISYASTSARLISQVKDLLSWRFGVYSGGISEQPPEFREHAVHTLYSFNIALPGSIRAFAGAIPLYGMKRVKLTNMLRLVEQQAGERTPGYTFMSSMPLGLLHTWDIEVGNIDHLFVLHNGLIVSNSTAEAGYFGKKLGLASNRLVVTEHDCGTDNGIIMPGDDRDNVGTILQKETNGVPAGTIIRPEHLSKLKGKQIMVRSPVTCQAAHGMCAKCSGVRERGALPDIGDNVGVGAAMALGERLSQSMLNVKHGGGAAGAKKTYTYDDIERFFEMPKSSVDFAPVAEEDGVVKSIRPAPAGGTDIMVGDHNYWVSTDSAVKVKVGQNIEAGEILSAGIPNPSLLAKHRGIGDARRMFIDHVREVTGDIVSRRNAEVLARAMVSHVRVNQLHGPNGTMIGDVPRYDDFVRGYEPREGSQEILPTQAKGHYLEKPVMHYTIGTRINDRVIKDLQGNGIKNIVAHKDPPGFDPDVQRMFSHSQLDPDWMARMSGYHLGTSIPEAVHRGMSSQEHGTSFVPALAKGVDFGTQTKETGTY